MISFTKHKHLWILIGICTLFILLRLPSLFEPHWYGDEGIYQVVARAMNNGRLLYQGIWDNKPPLLYIIYSFTNGDLFGAKLLSLLSGLLSIIAFFILSRELFKKYSASFISTFVFAILFALPILEGNIANAENFMLLPTILSAIFILKYSKSRKLNNILLGGIFLSISLALKIVAVFDFAAFLSFLLLINRLSESKPFIRHYFFFFILTLSLIFIFGFYFLLNGALFDFLQAVFLQNVNYVGEQNAYLFPMGILIIKTFLLVIFLVLILMRAKSISKNVLFIYIWIGFSVYSAFFSDRPYTHYLLLILPSISLLLGYILENKKKVIPNIVVLLVIIFACVPHFQIYKKNIAYYSNFIQFILGDESASNYESFFDNNTPRDYEIAGFIKLNTTENEQVFLWSDSAQIYALSNKLPVGKYIVSYHIKFYDKADLVTKKQIDKEKPKFIIQTAEGPIPSSVLSQYQLKYIMGSVKIYERQV